MTGSKGSAQSRQTDYHSIPTKPKATLFGSVLETVATKDVSMSNIDLDALEESLKPKIQVRDPPPVLGAIIKDSMKLEPVKAELDVRKKVFQEADADLKRLETHVRYFPGDFSADIATARQTPIHDQPQPLMTAKDLANASSMKVIGADPNNNDCHNRDLGEKRTPTPKRILNSNVLNQSLAAPQQNNRFDNALKNKTSHVFAEPLMQNFYDTSYHNHYGDEIELDLGDSTTVKLPKNIEHLFGSKVCREVLADKERVASMLEHQRAYTKSKRNDVCSTSSRSDESTRKLTSYEDLGNTLRYDHFPGFSRNQTGSHNKEVYTEAVHKNKEKGPSQWCNKRDELSAWAESNILRDRLKKAWEAKNNSQDSQVLKH